MHICTGGHLDETYDNRPHLPTTEQSCVQNFWCMCKKCCIQDPWCRCKVHAVVVRRGGSSSRSIQHARPHHPDQELCFGGKLNMTAWTVDVMWSQSCPTSDCQVPNKCSTSHLSNHQLVSSLLCDCCRATVYYWKLAFLLALKHTDSI